MFAALAASFSRPKKMEQMLTSRISMTIVSFPVLFHYHLTNYIVILPQTRSPHPASQITSYDTCPAAPSESGYATMRQLANFRHTAQQEASHSKLYEIGRPHCIQTSAPYTPFVKLLPFLVVKRLFQ